MHSNLNKHQVKTFKNLELFTLLPGLLRPFPALLRLVKRYGDYLVFQVKSGPVHLLLNHPNHVQHILKTNPENYIRSEAIFPIKALLGNGIFISESPIWDKQHLWLKPSFHEIQIKQYMEVVQGELKDLLGQWTLAAKTKTAVDLSWDLKKLMLKILVKTQISSQIKVDYDHIMRLLDQILKASSFEQLISTEIQKAVLKPFGIKVKDSADANLLTLEAIISEIVETVKLDKNHAGFTTKVLLDALERKELVYSDIRDMLLNLLFAGFDTTATGLAFTLDCLGRYPASQQLAYEEAAKYKGKGMDDLSVYKQMAYTKMVIQEGLRLFPPAWGIHRYTIHDDYFMGTLIKAKSYITISTYTLHRHPEFWERPNEFYPEHFIAEKMKGKAFAYIPFGQGQRMCIGKPLAMMEMQLILPELLSHFHFESLLSKEPEIKPGIIIQAKKPIKAHLTLRKA